MEPQIRLKNLPQEKVSELLPENLILLGYRGSIAHNMYVPQHDPNSIDDKDLMGVYVAPVEHYLGFGRNEVKEKFIDEWDAVSYEVKKFIGLLLKCNPNVLSLLWLPERHLIFQHELGRLLRENRALFVSKQAYHSFNGYAYARMGIEFLVEGDLHVERADAEQLLSIKRGDWTIERVKDESERLFKLAEEAYVRSSLPPKPDTQKAENLCMNIVARYHGLRGDFKLTMS